MIEQAMIFALGFLAASLFALLFLPVVSRRAVRLATRRLQMLVPLSMDEIVAERDQIRAEHAVAVRRLEQRIEGLDQGRAELMSQVGRQSTLALRLETERDAALVHNAALTTELDRVNRAGLATQAELGAHMQLLHDTIGLAERRLALLRGVEADLASARVDVEASRASVAALEARSTDQDLRLRSLLSQVGRAERAVRPAASPPPDGERDPVSTAPSPDDAALRKAIVALAEDLLRFAGPRQADIDLDAPPTAR